MVTALEIARAFRLTEEGPWTMEKYDFAKLLNLVRGEPFKGEIEKDAHSWAFIQHGRCLGQPVESREVVLVRCSSARV